VYKGYFDMESLYKEGHYSEMDPNYKEERKVFEVNHDIKVLIETMNKNNNNTEQEKDEKTET